jgi:hypothetical protein
MYFGDCLVTGLADDRRDGWVGEAIHDFVDGGGHVGVFAGVFALVFKLKVVRTAKHVERCTD